MTPRSTATSGRSPSSTPRVTRRSPPCEPVVPRRPTWSILVVAADDGVKPQTTEALNHAQAAGVPIVVAVNKIDKEGADPARVRAQLTEYGLVAEEFGGQTLFVDVSARNGTGIDELLEAVVLTADAELDLRANPQQEAPGRRDRGAPGQGPRPGRDRAGAARHAAGRRLDRLPARPSAGSGPCSTRTATRSPEAPPSRPVQVLGLTAVPGAGDSFLVVDDDRMARQIAERREARERTAHVRRSAGRGSRWRTWSRRSSPASGKSCCSSSRATCPVRSRRSRTRCSRSTSARRSCSGSSAAASARSPRTTSTWPSPPKR